LPGAHQPKGKKTLPKNDAPWYQEDVYKNVIPMAQSINRKKVTGGFAQPLFSSSLFNDKLVAGTDDWFYGLCSATFLHSASTLIKPKLAKKAFRLLLPRALFPSMYT